MKNLLKNHKANFIVNMLVVVKITFANIHVLQQQNIVEELSQIIDLKKRGVSA